MQNSNCETTVSLSVIFKHIKLRIVSRNSLETFQQLLVL